MVRAIRESGSYSSLFLPSKILIVHLSFKGMFIVQLFINSSNSKSIFLPYNIQVLEFNLDFFNEKITNLHKYYKE